MRKASVQKVAKIALIIILALFAVVGLLVGIYLFRNATLYDNKMDKAWEVPYVEKQTTLSDGSTINYAEGPDNGPPLLLIHGQGMQWEDYYNVLPDLAKNYHVFAVDCFGHGGSSHNPELYTCEAGGRALIEFVDQLIGEPVIVSGHSSGGIYAAWLAAYAPHLVSGLVLEDPPFFRVTPDEMQEGSGTFAWKDSEVIHEFLNQTEESDYVIYYMKHSYFTGLFGDLRLVMADEAEKWRSENPGQPLKMTLFPNEWFYGIHYIDDYDLRFGETFYTGSWFEGIDQEEILKNIQCPTIYLKTKTNYGEDGVLYAANTDEDAERVQALISNCKMLVVESGHDIHYEKPKDFLEALSELELLKRDA